MKAIILGCGRQGALLAKMLENENITITIIDRDPESFNRLSGFDGKKVLGDGIMESTLIKAGIKKADAFIAVTNNDNTNLMSAQIARGIYQITRVVCRVYDPRKAAIYSDFGLETVNFSQTSAQILKSAVLGPGVVKKYQLGDGTAVAVQLKLNHESCNKKVSELEIPDEFKVSAIIRRLKVIIPEPDTKILEGDQVFGVVKVERLSDLLKRLSVKETQEKETKEGTD